MKKIISTMLSVFMAVTLFGTRISAQDDPQISAIFNAETRTIDVTASEDFIARVADSSYATALCIDDWQCWYHESMVTNKTATGFSVSVNNALGDQGKTVTFRIDFNSNNQFYEDYQTQITVTPANGNGGTSELKQPEIQSAVYNEENNSIDVVCATSEYFSAIKDLYFNNWNTEIGDASNVTVNETARSFSITTLNGIGRNDGNYTFKIVANGYNPFTFEFSISKYGSGGSGEATNSFPSDFSAEVNNDGDLLIYSSDSDFLDAMVKQYSNDFSVIIGECGQYYDYPDIDDYKIPSYFFGAVNTSNDYGSWTPLKREGNLVKLSVEDQLNGPEGQIYRGQILNDVPYTLSFKVEGYGSYTLNTPVTFPKSNKRIPKDYVTAYIAKGTPVKDRKENDYLIISATGEEGIDFISNIYAGNIGILDKHNIATTVYGSGERVTSSIYDTISDSLDCIFRIDASAVQDIQDWTGFIDAAGYGQYCYDGRIFGGVVNMGVNEFDVKKHYIDGDNTDKAFGIYTLPTISPVSGKAVQGWKVINKGTDVTRCVGEEIFITADTELYAIYIDAEPELVDVGSVRDEIILNTVKRIRVENNAFNIELNNDSFIGSSDKAAGTLIWIEAVEKKDGDPQYEQVERTVSLDSANVTLLSVLDVNVFKQVGTDAKAIKITETESYVEITIDLSSNEEAQKLAENGTLGLFSIHEGVKQGIIGGVYDANTKIYTFRANLFSTFALVGTDINVNTVTDSSKKPSQSSNKDKADRNKYPYEVVNTSVK